MTFTDSGVTVRNATPVSQVIVFGVGSEPLGYYSNVIRFERVAEADRNGVAVYELERSIPLKSVWAAVDLRTGRFSVQSPPGFLLRTFDVELGIGRHAGRPHILYRGGLAEVLCVRPGLGAWSVRAADGGRVDADGAENTTTVIDLESMRAVATSPPAPREFTPGDIVIAIDPRELLYSAVRLSF